MLEFSFTAELDRVGLQVWLGVQTVRFSKWKKKFIKTRQEAAWAYVRGQLEWPGVWHCTITMDGETEERDIQVEQIRGCSELSACIVDGIPCHWVEPGLCSACVSGSIT